MGRASTALLSLVFALVARFLLFHFFGGSPPFDSADRAADFLKVALALPGPLPASGSPGFDRLVNFYATSRDYRGELGVLHHMPLSIMGFLTARYLFAIINPVILFLTLTAAFLTALCLVVRRYTGNVVWALVVMCSFPILYLVDRGNLNSALTGLCIITALLRRKPDWIAVILLALALNARPNALFCALPLVLIDWRFAARLCLVGLAIMLVSFTVSHAIDPGYTVASSRANLAVYVDWYVTNGRGILHGSSLYGALYALGYPHRYFLPGLIGLGLLLPATLLHLRQRLDYSSFVFVCCAVTAMTTAVFADYHLVIFLVPLILSRDPTTFVASLLLLAPVPFGMNDHDTLRVVLNPAIMVAATVGIIARSLLVAPHDRKFADGQ